MARISQTYRAQFLQRTLGTRIAAGYLRNRGWSIEAAVFLLAAEAH